MKGTIRILLGFVLTLGGVGGMEQNTVDLIPLDSLSVAVLGLVFLAWGALAANRQESMDSKTW